MRFSITSALALGSSSFAACAGAPARSDGSAARPPPPALEVAPPAGSVVTTESIGDAPDARCARKELGQCRVFGETLVQQARANLGSAAALRERAYRAFEQECALRKLTNQLLGPPPEPTASAPGDPALAEARAAALREAMEFGMTGLSDAGLDRVAAPEPELEAYLAAHPTPFSTCVTHFARHAEGKGRGARVTTPVTLAAEPRGRLQVGAAMVAGTLDREAIAPAVAALSDDFRRCYAAGLERGAKLGGRIGLRMYVDPAGLPYTVENGGSDLPDADVVTCVLVRAFDLRFPAGHASAVSVPVLLHP